MAQGAWQKRADDAVTEVDLANVMKKVHPAYTLQHDAIVFLSAIMRELLKVIVGRVRGGGAEVLPEDAEAVVLEVRKYQHIRLVYKSRSSFLYKRPKTTLRK